MIQRLIVLSMLTACSREDILYRRICIRWLAYFAAAGIFCQFVAKKQLFPELLLGLVPGFAILIFSVLSRGSIGQGDGMILMVVGICLGAAATMRIIVYAVFVSAVCALFLYFGKKKDRDYEMPFVPFLLAAFLSDMVLEGGGIW